MTGIDGGPLKKPPPLVELVRDIREKNDARLIAARKRRLVSASVEISLLMYQFP
jgi:hypothetical protein